MKQWWIIEENGNDYYDSGDRVSVTPITYETDQPIYHVVEYAEYEKLMAKILDQAKWALNNRPPGVEPVYWMEFIERLVDIP